MAPPETWLWIDFVGPADRLELLQAELADTRSCGAEEREMDGAVCLRVYWPLDEGPEAWLAGAEECAAVAGVAVGGHGVQAREDWIAAWRVHFTPLLVGRGIWICPPWDVRGAQSGEHTIVVEPKMAFGTGHHATTQLCLELLESLVSPGDQLVDVGCGSGILAIAVVKLGAAHALALDVDQEAVANTRENVRLNGVSDRVRVKHGTFAQEMSGPGTHIVCNILTARLLPLLPEFARALRDGWLLVSGIGAEHRDEALRAVAAAGLRLEQERSRVGWIAFVCRRIDGGAPGRTESG